MLARCGFGSRWTHFSLCVCSLKVAHPNQVVSGSRKGEHPAYPVQTAEPSLALQCHGLHPPEYFLHSLPLALADGIAVAPRGALVNRAVPVAIVLSHVRRHIQFAGAGYTRSSH